MQLQCLPAMKELEEKVFKMSLPQDELSESVIKHFSDVVAACPAFVWIIKSKLDGSQNSYTIILNRFLDDMSATLSLEIRWLSDLVQFES